MDTAYNFIDWYFSELTRTEILFDYGLKSMVVLAGGWTLMCIVFELAEATGLMERWRINPVEKTRGKIRWDAVKESYMNWSWICALLPLSGPIFAKYFPLDAPYPNLMDLTALFVGSLLVFDVWFYLFHRVVHEVPYLYINYHKPHHVYKHTMVWMSHCQHPVEIMLNSIGTFAGPVLWILLTGQPVNMHLIWAWFVIVQLFGVVDHSGFDLPPLAITFMPFLAPILTTPQEHDEHHRLFNVNYGGFLNCWDHLFGTHAVNKQNVKRQKTN